MARDASIDLSVHRDVPGCRFKEVRHACDGSSSAGSTSLNAAIPYQRGLSRDQFPDRTVIINLIADWIDVALRRGAGDRFNYIAHSVPVRLRGTDLHLQFN